MIRCIKPPSFDFKPSLTDKEFRLSILKKTVVFIGDSVTRYQYLNLIYFLELGTWPDPFFHDKVMKGNPCCEQSFQNWDTFYQEVNQAFNGNELCDCWKRSDILVENRRYYNRELDCHVIFVWYGRSPIYMRQNFALYPYDIICDLNDTNCVPDVTTTFDTFTIGSIVENVTHAFHPDLLFLNWGHHHTYYTNTKGGRWVYADLTGVLDRLKASSYKTRFIFKKTTPVCHSQVKNEEGRILQCLIKGDEDTYSPDLLCMKLIADHYLENFDAHLYIRLLSKGVRASHYAAKRDPILSNTTSVEDAYPLYWDRTHPHCWVMTQLNRMLLATYFTKSTFSV